MKDAPFHELAVPDHTTDPDAKAGRGKLLAALADLQSQDTAPAKKIRREKKKSQVPDK